MLSVGSFLSNILSSSTLMFYIFLIASSASLHLQKYFLYDTAVYCNSVRRVKCFWDHRLGNNIGLNIVLISVNYTPIMLVFSCDYSAPSLIVRSLTLNRIHFGFVRCPGSQFLTSSSTSTHRQEGTLYWLPKILVTDNTSHLFVFKRCSVILLSVNWTRRRGNTSYWRQV